MHDPLSRLCVVRLTQLLELNSVEGLQHLEECSYVSKNILIEEQEKDFELCHINSKPFKDKSPKNQVKKLFGNISKKETPHVFGQQLCENTLEMIIMLIEYLKENASTEGLFRISGNKKRQEELKSILNKKESVDLDASDCPFNSHDIAGILKYFFSELPEPLLTKNCFVCYQQLAGKLKEMDSASRYQRKIETLRLLFLLLPPLNRLLLKKLIDMLAVVAADQHNKMTSFNLGVIFAPNVVCTRQPMGCLSDFTENVEPFTDLVKFIIENSDAVFEIPKQFLEEGKVYMEKVADDRDQDVEVPMSRTYCERMDSKQFAKQAKENTNQELMLLYSQMSEMPDGPVKREFLEKFKQSYPGTPIFIPKSIKEMRKDSMDLSSCPSTPGSKTKIGCLTSCSVKKAASENFLDNLSNAGTPISKKNNVGTPGRSEDNILSVCQSSKKTSQTPSTPTRMKNMYKRIRKRSIELFKPKTKNGRGTDEIDSDNFSTNTKYLPGVSSNTKSSASRLKDYFRHHKGGVTFLKKSVSTPILVERRKGSFNFEEDPNEKRKLSFSSDCGSVRISQEDPLVSALTSFDQGFLNDAFVDVESWKVTEKTQTPIIRKPLGPINKATHTHTDESIDAVKKTRELPSTPKIMKPSYKGTSTSEQQHLREKQVKNPLLKGKIAVLGGKQTTTKTPLKENMLNENRISFSTQQSKLWSNNPSTTPVLSNKPSNVTLNTSVKQKNKENETPV